MALLRQFDKLIIKDYITDVFLFEPHGHTYFEVIYIHTGKGSHLLNHNQLFYEAGDLFLLAPGDHHHFTVEEPTRFVVIKFTEDYFRKAQISSEEYPSDIFPPSVMRMQELKENKIAFSEASALLLKSTIENITACAQGREVSSSSYLRLQLLSVFALIKAEALPGGLIRSHQPAMKQALIEYIHGHIYDPQQCRIKTIARYFHLSPGYFGDYFKRNFGISYRDYTHAYRISLIEKRIAGKQVSMKNIAREFGFSDESHFSNYFNRRRQSRPTKFIAMSSLESTINNKDL